MGEPASGDLGLDDLDAALNNLEVKLKGSAPSDMLVRRDLGLGMNGVGVRARQGTQGSLYFSLPPG